MADSIDNVEERDASLFRPSKSEINLLERHVEDMLLESGSLDIKTDEKRLLRDLLDISPTLNEAASAIIDDSFTRCFKSNTPEPWNWNIYLFPLWVCGVIIRYGILFPIRLVLLTVGWVIFLGLFIPVHFGMKNHDELRQKFERGLVEFICSVFVASWTGVVKYHGPKPSRRAKQVGAVIVILFYWKQPLSIQEGRCLSVRHHHSSSGVKIWIISIDLWSLLQFGDVRPFTYTFLVDAQVFVANHTSMIDFIILEQMTAFAVIMQKHPGWVGLLQTTVLESLGCIWFNRTESKDRLVVAKKLRHHVENPTANPLLIFPEGTCVNNEYTVMFKKGAFELDCTVCPIAIKYNKIFVDAFWNSKKQSFTMHLIRLMTSWAVVCDVWYLEPQTLQKGETPIEFAERVRTLIADRAGIKKVPWDGYLKYYRPSIKLTEKKQQKFADSVVRRLE
jgi:1-acyl-sn-glycerol-3-phosphate acyltransferase